MTEADIRNQVAAVLDGDKNEALAKKAVANLVASLLVNVQRIADALEGQNRILDRKG